MDEVGLLRLAVCMSFCLAVRTLISKTTCPNYSKFSVGVTLGRHSVPFDDNVKLCTSGFVNDVIFSHNGTDWKNRALRCFVEFARCLSFTKAMSDIRLPSC